MTGNPLSLVFSAYWGSCIIWCLLFRWVFEHIYHIDNWCIQLIGVASWWGSTFQNIYVFGVYLSDSTLLPKLSSPNLHWPLTQF
jgi:hypothetical protein